MRRPITVLALLSALSACSQDPAATASSAAVTTSATATATTSAEPTASVAATASAVTSSDALADLSGSAPLPAPPPPPKVDPQAAKIAAELEQLDVKLLGALSSNPKVDLMGGPAPDAALLDSIARSGVPGGVMSDGGSLRAGTSGGGGLASIGDSGTAVGTRVVKIGGKPLEEASVDDLEKAITAAACSSTREPNTAPLLVLPTTCEQQRFTITLVPKGTKLDAAKREAMVKDAAVLEQGGATLVVRPEPPADLAAASSLLAKLKREPNGKASLGGASVAGGTVSNAASVVAGMAAGFRRCFNRGLQEDPNMHGNLKLVLTLGPNGEVTRTDSTGGTGLSDTVIACAKARASSAQFAPPEGAGPTTITIPLTLSVQ